ncbi:MAG: hypothetical protein WBE37_16695, partial [Bryobacteraceae bacterium]
LKPLEVLDSQVSEHFDDSTSLQRFLQNFAKDPGTSLQRQDKHGEHVRSITATTKDPLCTRVAQHSGRIQLINRRICFRYGRVQSYLMIHGNESPVHP